MTPCRPWTPLVTTYGTRRSVVMCWSPRTGFQRHLGGRPYVLITSLRNPLELFVSAKQYQNRSKTKTLQKVSTGGGYLLLQRTPKKWTTETPSVVESSEPTIGEGLSIRIVHLNYFISYTFVFVLYIRCTCSTQKQQSAENQRWIHQA